jgi:RNA polymerase sigma-70 factor (ECF subfamily)
MESSSATDTAELVRAAKEGDREALGTLLSRFEPQVRRIVSLNLGRSLAALTEDDDLVQEAMVEALRGFQRLEYRGEGALIAWLVSLAESRIQQFGRHVSRKKRARTHERTFSNLGSVILTESYFVSPEATPSQCAQAGELESLLEQALLALPERDRRIVLLRQVAGLSHCEISEQLGMTEVAVRTVFARALARIGASLPAGLAPIRT